jgi:hypothetical protein
MRRCRPLSRGLGIVPLIVGLGDIAETVLEYQTGLLDAYTADFAGTGIDPPGLGRIDQAKLLGGG